MKKIIRLKDFQYECLLERFNTDRVEESFIIIDGRMESSFEINIECIFSNHSKDCKDCFLKDKFILVKDHFPPCYMYSFLRNTMAWSSSDFYTIRFYSDNVSWLKKHDKQTRDLFDRFKDECLNFIDIYKLNKEDLLLDLERITTEKRIVKSLFRRSCAFDYNEVNNCKRFLILDKLLKIFKNGR